MVELLKKACAATEEARLTPAQCALLAHDLPAASRYRLIEHLCATVQKLASARPGTGVEAMSGKALLDAALANDASLAEARETIQRQREQIAALREQTLAMQQQLVEREAQLAWPSVRAALALQGPVLSSRPHRRLVVYSTRPATRAPHSDLSKPVARALFFLLR